MSRAKPTNIKKIEGTYRKDRHLENEVEYSSIEDITVPESLQNNPDEKFIDDAVNHWLHFTKELKSVNLLYSTDLHELELLCYWIAISRKCMRDMKSFTESHTNKAGFTNQVVSSHFKVLKDATEQVNKLSAKFGFSPIDKMKIAIPEKKSKNPFDEI